MLLQGSMGNHGLNRINLNLYKERKVAFSTLSSSLIIFKITLFELLSILQFGLSKLNNENYGQKSRLTPFKYLSRLRCYVHTTPLLIGIKEGY